MKKKCNVVMITTDKAESYLYTNPGGVLFHNIRNTVKKDSICRPQHLYILSDDEIKEGDHYADEFGNIGKAFKNNAGFYKNCKKIIATTDSSLKLSCKYARNKKWFDSLPSIPQSFIDKYVSEYNKGNKIEEVMVQHEYDIDDNFVENALLETAGKKTDYSKSLIPKLNPDNTIKVSHIKDSWSREELFDLKKAYEDSKLYVRSHDYREQCVQKIFHWIETNL